MAFELSASDVLFEGVDYTVSSILRFLEGQEPLALAGVNGGALHGCFFLSFLLLQVCPPGYRISIERFGWWCQPRRSRTAGKICG